MLVPAFAFVLALADAAAPAAPPVSPSPPAAATTPAPPAPLAPAVAKQILRVRGADIVDGGGHVVMLRGVAFGNQVWSNVRLPRKDHAEVDYQASPRWG